MPVASFANTGACLARVESADTPLDVRAFTASGESLTVPASGVGRVYVRLVPSARERVYVVVRTAVPSRIRVSFASVALDAPLPSDAGASTPRTIPVGPSVVATASRRVAARRDSSSAVGFVGTDVRMAQSSLEVPELGGSCAFALVSVDGGSIAVGGATLESGGDATWMICERSASLSVAVTSGRPSVAVAWLIPRNPPSPTANPSMFMLVSELRARGFTELAGTRLVALDPEREVAVPIALASGECVAVGAIGDAGVVTLSLASREGTLLARSQSSAPASRVYHCATAAEDVVAHVTTREGTFDAHVFVGRSDP